MYGMHVPEWTFLKYTFYINGRILKDISRKSIAELTLTEYTFYQKFQRKTLTKPNLTHEKTKKNHEEMKKKE